MEPPKHGAEIEPGVGIAGLKRDGPAEPASRLAKVTGEREHGAEVSERFGMVRVEGQRLGETSLRFPVSLQREVRLAQIVQHHRMRPPGADRSLDRPYRVLVSRLLVRKHAAQVQRARVVRLDFENAAVKRIGLGEPARLVVLNGDLQFVRKSRHVELGGRSVALGS